VCNGGKEVVGRLAWNSAPLISASHIRYPRTSSNVSIVASLVRFVKIHGADNGEVGNQGNAKPLWFAV